MDRPPQPQQIYVNLGRNATETARKLKHMASIQTPLENFENVKIQSNGEALISTWEGSADTSEAIFASRYGYNIYGSGNSPGSNISSSLEISTDAEVPGGSQNHNAPDDISMVSSVNTNKRKRSVSNYSMPAKNSQPHKRTRSEIFDKRDKYLSTNRALSMNYDKALEINSICRSAFQNSSLTSINHNTKNISQSLPNNQESSNYEKPLSISGENIASDISFTEIYRNKNAPSVNSVSVASERSVWSVDDILAKPGPSGLNINDDSINVSGDTLKSWNQLKMPSIKRKVDKILTCNVCKSEIFAHSLNYFGKILYECCICSYSSCEKADLQIHSDNHHLKKYCNICEKEHMDGNSHDGEHSCIVCLKKLKCKTELNEHILNHEDYFKTHCWVCSKEIKEHFSNEKGAKFYLCCSCPSKRKYKQHFREHINMHHRPKIFCKVCKEEYPIEEKDLHNSIYTCVLCKKHYKCKTMLEDHTIDHKTEFNFRCRVCYSGIVEYHKIETEKIFFCCKCSEKFDDDYELQNHLYTHTDLNLFKCVRCGKRFKERKSLARHWQMCPVLRYKCERCAAAFPFRDILDLHCSVKHKKT